MNPERYRQIDQIFQAALAQEPANRPAFLDEACSVDEALRQEVESLLTSDQGGLSFIDEPAFDMAARLLATDEPELALGEHVDRYKIISLLGSGGMGEVYLAHDEKLDRQIALKLLPSDFTANSQRVSRFQQEARAVSALNHPNIITIHEIGHFENRHFIATEFIDGETLRQRMKRERLSLHESLAIAVEVCSALAAAHKAGIVHRDIKPENVMLRPDGYVKVLDFGLAKLTDQREPAPDARNADSLDASSGLVMGTLRYMSPEQARGLPVDPRSDIFSLGVVFYEMIAGRPPFAGENANDLIDAILKKEPPPLDNVPEEIARLVSRAMRKKKTERYQSIQDFLADLEALNEDKAIAAIARTGSQHVEGFASSTSATGAISTASTFEYVARGVRRHKTRTAFILAGLVVIALGLSFGLKRFISALRAPSRNNKIIRVPNTGKSVAAAISHDGKFLAHAVQSAGRQSLWLIEVATNATVELVPAADADYSGLTFSQDGKDIFYASSGTLYQVPVRGGETRKVLSGVVGAISFSPEGRRFTFMKTIGEESALMIANVDGSGEQILTTRKKPALLYDGPAWSPNGKFIAFGSGMAAGDREVSVLGINMETSKEETITAQKWQGIDRLAWFPDGKGLIVPAVEFGTSPSQIWYIPIQGGEARRITSDLNNYGDLGLSDDGESLVTIQFAQRSQVWVVPNGNPGQARPITSGENELYRVITATRDGRILYVSNAGNNRDIWVMNVDGTNPKQLTANAGNNLWPDVSPDGRFIVFASNRAKKNAYNIWRMDIDGGNPIQLTHGSGEVQPVCSPDERWVVYSQGGPDTSAERKTLWKVPINGGEPVQLTKTPSNGAAVSPDGTMIACWYKQEKDSPWQIALIPLDGGPPTRLFDSERPHFKLRWTSDGQAVSYGNTREGVSNIWSQPIGGGPPKPVTQFTSQQIDGFDWMPSGELICARNYTARDIVLISDFR